MKTLKLTNKSLKIRCYDNGGKTADRYTVVYLEQKDARPNIFACVGMNSSPFHPQGFGQHSTAMLGRHLGKSIEFSLLPPDCQKLVKQDLGINK